jgi:hypothetical protein
MATVHAYQYIQDAPSDVWSINHNLGVYPVVDVVVNYQGSVTKIIPQDIVVIDVNNIEIRFTTPYSGQARLV